MAAIVGLESIIREGPIGPSSFMLSVTLFRLDGSTANAPRSAPAQKVPPAPYRMATFTASS